MGTKTLVIMRKLKFLADALAIILCASNVMNVTTAVIIIMTESITETGDEEFFRDQFTVFLSAARCIVSSISTQG